MQNILFVSGFRHQILTIFIGVASSRFPPLSLLVFFMSNPSFVFVDFQLTKRASFSPQLFTIQFHKIYINFPKKRTRPEWCDKSFLGSLLLHPLKACHTFTTGKQRTIFHYVPPINQYFLHGDLSRTTKRKIDVRSICSPYRNLRVFKPFRRLSRHWWVVGARPCQPIMAIAAQLKVITVRWNWP